MENRIIIAGTTPPHSHFQDIVYYGGGISRTMTARDYKDAMRVFLYETKKTKS